MRLSVVIPTISGREESLARAIAAYRDTLRDQEWELIVVTDKANWPTACNEGYRKATGDVIHFSADDLEPLPGCWDEVLPWLQAHDELPAPKVLNHSADGEFDNAADGEDGQRTHFTRIPILRRDQYERIGPWPEIVYLADVWLSEKARLLGMETRLFYSYAFVHHWHQVGRLDSDENLRLAHHELARLRHEMKG